MLSVDLRALDYFLYFHFYDAGNLGQFKLGQCYLNYPNAPNPLKFVYFNPLVAYN